MIGDPAAMPHTSMLIGNTSISWTGMNHKSIASQATAKNFDFKNHRKYCPN